MINDYWLTWYESLAAYRYATLQRYHVRVIEDTSFALEPVTLEDAWRHLNIDVDGSPPASDHDDWLEMIGIPGARSWCEAYQEVSIGQKTLELTTDRFPDTDYIDLPFGPVTGIVSLKYLDGGGNEIEWPDPGLSPVEEPWLLDAYSKPHRLYLAYDTTWPDDIRSVRNAIRIRYTAGYSLVGESPFIEAMPYRTRVGLLLLLGHLFNNREDTTVLKLDQLPIGVRSFLDWDRVRPDFV